MARDKIDEVPMLLDSQSQSSQDYPLPNVELQSFPMGRSMSISLPMREGLGWHENERRDIPFSGPLRNDERRCAFIPLSGPLQSNRVVNIARVSMSGPLRTDREVEERVVNSHVSVSGGGGEHGMDNNYGGKHEHLLKSGPLGRCNDPFCTTCPPYCEFKDIHTRNAQSPLVVGYPVQGTFFGDVNHSIKNLLSQLWAYIPGIMSPHAKIVQQWNKFFVISCLVAIFVDPLFFFLLSVKKSHSCIFFNKTLALVITVVRSTTDFVYFLHILLQFRLAYIAPESRVVGAGDLVDDPREIAHHYIFGYFLVDLFVVLPLPQIMIWVLLRNARSTANYAKNLLRVTVLLQYVPRMIRFLPLLAGRSATGFVFESAWANFVINLLIFILVGHVVGSCWYLFGLQRVNQCLRDACTVSNITDCLKFIDCGDGTINFKNGTSWPDWPDWLNNTNGTNCLDTVNKPLFQYGIYSSAVPLTTTHSVMTKYIYSLFWGFQQISTLAGNQTPSLFVGEVLFTMGIVGLGLLLFALLIGNMQNFLQSLGRRRLEMQLRRRDVELWMDRRRLPAFVRRRVRESERFKWAANRGVNEEQLLEDLPEDLQREIRRHLCLDLVKKVRIFTVMDDQVLDAICERLRQRLYIVGNEILRIDYPIDKMIFIVRGNLESTGKDSGSVNLSGGDICGEELLTWCLEHTPLQKQSKKFRRTGQRAISSRTVRCTSSVEAFCLQAADLEEVTTLFSRLLRNPRVQGAIRYESPYWRTWAASCVQVAWKYRKKRLHRSATANH